MKTFTGLLDYYQSLSRNTSSANQSLGATLINDSIRTIYNIRGGKWWFLESTQDVNTVADQRGYQIPNKFRKLMDVYVTVGDQIYWPQPVFDPVRWKMILASHLGSSDVQLFYYRFNNKVEFAPIPSSNGNPITFRGRIETADLNIADYTTGTITSIANGATALVGNGTTWTADMVGRFIRITQTTAANGGDGQWYEIGSFTDATHIGLLKPYNGTSISAATAAYTIGQTSLIPEAYDSAPVFRALAIYWDTQGETNKAQRYWKQYDGGQEAGLSKVIGGLIGQMIENEGETVEGSYISPWYTMFYWDDAKGSLWSPWQNNGSGF